MNLDKQPKDEGFVGVVVLSAAIIAVLAASLASMAHTPPTSMANEVDRSRSTIGRHVDATVAITAVVAAK